MKLGFRSTPVVLLLTAAAVGQIATWKGTFTAKGTFRSPAPLVLGGTPIAASSWGNHNHLPLITQPTIPFGTMRLWGSANGVWNTIETQGVGSVTVTNGGSCSSTPMVSFSGGGGSGATATASLTSGHVSAITVTAQGKSFWSVPSVVLTGGSCTGVVATANLVPVFDFSGIQYWIDYANTHNVDLWFTFGQMPRFGSTMPNDMPGNYPLPFPVANNGISWNNGVVTVSTLVRVNATAAAPNFDSVTVAGATGCPFTVNSTFTLTGANNGTPNAPWTYSFNLPAATGSGTCGGSAITFTDTNKTLSDCNGTGSPPNGQGGGCYSPADIAIDGTGTDAFLINLETQFLAWLSTNDPNHRMKYWEMWNEPQGKGFFNGSIAQMARMQLDTFNTVASSGRPDIVVTAPAPSGGLTSPGNYLGLFGADPSQPFQFVKLIPFHSYNFSNNNVAPNPLDVLTTTANVKAAIAGLPFAAGKPLAVSEGGWGSGLWATQGAQGPNNGTAAALNHANWMAIWRMGHICAGMSKYYDFGWDQNMLSGEITGTTPPISILPSGLADGFAHDWLVGGTLTQTCSKDTSNNWTAQITRPGGYTGMMLWNQNLSAVGSYTITAGVWIDYRDISGNIFTILPNQTSVPVQGDPIFLESKSRGSIMAAPFIAGTLPNGNAGTSYWGPLAVLGGVPPYSWNDRMLPSALTAAGLSIDPVSGLVSGTPTVIGTYKPVIGVMDSTGQTFATNFTIVINAPGTSCGAPTFPCSSRSTAPVPNPTPPFSSTTAVNHIAFDTSLNPYGLNPYVQATDSTTHSNWSCTVSPSGGANDNLWATDKSKFFGTCINGNSTQSFIFFFDPTNFQITGKVAAPANTGGGVAFSRTNPNVLYSSNQGTSDIYQTTFTGTSFVQTLFYSPRTSCAPLVGTTGTAGVLSLDVNDLNFELDQVSAGQNAPGWIMHYDVAANKCEVVDTSTGIVTLEDGSSGAAVGTGLCWPIGVHAGYMFRNGLWGSFSTAAITGGVCTNAPHHWQFGTRNIKRCDDFGSGTCGPNHDTNGYAVRVISPTITGQGGKPQLYYYNQTDTLPPPVGQFYGTIPNQNDEHFTSFGNGPNIDTNPIVGETDKLLWDGSPFTNPGEDEVWAMARTPLQLAPLIRLGHNFTSGAAQCANCDFRDQQAIGATAQDGSAMVITSDMGLTMGTDAHGDPAQHLFVIGLDRFFGSSSSAALIANNTPGCTANGSPDSGCNGVFIGTVTTAGNTNAQTKTVNIAPGQVSSKQIPSLLYSGSTTAVDCYYQPWFWNSATPPFTGGSPYNGHVNIFQDESATATIAKQAAAMVARGCTDVVFDWYGTDTFQTYTLAVVNAWAAYLVANPSVALKMAIMIDKGALSPFCPTGSTDQTSCLITQLETFFDYIDANYGPGSGKNIYALDGSGNPLVWYFIIKAAWSGTNFSTNSSGVYPQVQTYAHAHYSKPYQILDENAGAFTELGIDGGYAWLQPPVYSNTNSSQLCWNDIVGETSGHPCSATTGVGGGVAYLGNFYSTARAHSSKHAVGAIYKGFDWSIAGWKDVEKIIAQQCGNVLLFTCNAIGSAGYSSSSQLERVGVMWNDYEEGHATETGIDNCVRPSASISSGALFSWLVNPTDTTYYSVNTIDHWTIWYGPNANSMAPALDNISPSVSFEDLTTLVPHGSWQVEVCMTGKAEMENRCSNPVTLVQ